MQVILLIFWSQNIFIFALSPLPFWGSFSLSISGSRATSSVLSHSLSISLWCVCGSLSLSFSPNLSYLSFSLHLCECVSVSLCLSSLLPSLPKSCITACFTFHYEMTSSCDHLFFLPFALKVSLTHSTFHLCVPIWSSEPFQPCIRPSTISTAAFSCLPFFFISAAKKSSVVIRLVKLNLVRCCCGA